MKAIPQFEEFVGIDYSGAGTHFSELDNLRVFVAQEAGGDAKEVDSPAGAGRWSREGVRRWLFKLLSGGSPKLVGIDHGFSLPSSRLSTAGIQDWGAVLERFQTSVGTSERRVALARLDPNLQGFLDEPEDFRAPESFRLTEQRTQAAKSVLDFRPRGVAFSTIAGIAQLAVLRAEIRAKGRRVHFWPFDGFTFPEGTSVVLEIYPSLLLRRINHLADLTADQRDARCAALWLREIVRDGHFGLYARPPLTEQQERLARLEGWILGVM